MNNRTILVIAVILAFIAGFMSAEIVVVRGNVGGNTCTVIEAKDIKVIPINDREYYPIVFQKIENASVSIHIVMYEMKWYGNPDNDTHKVSLLGRALVSAEKRGVDVKVILEDGKGYDFESPELIEWSKEWSTYFEGHGVQVKFDWSNQTTHDKLIIIDGEMVIVGSTNWSSSALSYNHEANVLIESKDVAEQYENYFSQLWNTYQ